MGHKMGVCENHVLNTAKGIKMSLEDQKKKQRGFGEFRKSKTILGPEKNKKFWKVIFSTLKIRQTKKNLESNI